MRWCAPAGIQVHRDIKSENVLLAEGGRCAKWADLGVADDENAFAGDQLSGLHGFSQKDRRWAAPEEIRAMRRQQQREVRPGRTAGDVTWR